VAREVCAFWNKAERVVNYKVCSNLALPAGGHWIEANQDVFILSILSCLRGSLLPVWHADRASCIAACLPACLLLMRL